jgi:solute carrier family 13 (sodium-dependent dicarboxylate transporter), member 2/3/5
MAETGADREEQEPPEDEDVTLHAGATYRSIGEQKLTPKEERFEKGRRTIGLFLGPLALLLVAVLPMDIPPEQQNLAAVLAFVIIYWISEAIPIPITGLIGIVLCVVLNVGSADDVIGAFGDPAIFLFIGAFVIAEAMLKHGVARRFAFRMLALRAVGGSAARTVIAFGIIAAVLSAFISNTATVAMLLPTALGILGTLITLMRRHHDVDWEHALDAEGNFDPAKLHLGTALMLMLAYGAGVGGLLTPIGSPPNIIGRGLIEEATDTRIGFLQWMVVALPICLAMFVILAVILLLLNRPETKHVAGIQDYVHQQRAKLGPLSTAERNTLIAFTVAVVLWILPGMVGLIAGTESAAYETVTDRLDEGVIAVLAASLLFFLPLDWKRREFTLNWSDAAGIDWGTILLFGAGIVFGALLRETGLAEAIGTSTAETFGISSFVPITIFAIVIAILISETTSNTASASIVVPIVLPVAIAAGINPLIPGMAAIFGASFGFMLPVSTPQNAIVYGSGFVPITRMVRSGVVFDFLGALVILVGIPVMVALVLM